MKRFFKWIGILLIILILPVMILAGVLFVRPLLIVNPQNLAWVLKKVPVFESWSWKEARFTHERKSWFHRNFEGEFKDFCFQVKKPAAEVKSCLTKISWDFDLSFSWKKGFKTDTIRPFYVLSPLTEVTPGEPAPKPKESEPPDLYHYWTLLWSDFVPDMDFNFQKVVIKKEKPLEFDIHLLKLDKSLKVTALDFTLTADPSGFVLNAPAKYPFPKDLGATRPLYLRNFQLAGKVNKTGIPLDLTGSVETVKVKAESFIQLPLKGDFSSLAFRKDALLRSRGEIRLTGLQTNLRDYAPRPYNRLPAPFSNMDGEILVNVSTEDRNKNSVLVKGGVNINLRSKEQVFNVTVNGNTPLLLTDFSRGITTIGIVFHEVTFKLPRLSKKEPPPQFKPDGRFKSKLAEKKKEEKKTAPPVNVHLTALDKEALHIVSNLLDEPLRLNLDLDVKNSEVKDGFIKILPLKTTVFKRPIHVKDVLIKFHSPLEPVIDGTIVFPLPQYKVTMELEGPLSKPRYAFRSEPPLPQNDIYAVLLFGRPMSELAPEDKASAGKTNQILSQGLLSLATLYYLSGSPVEYVGYDPSSQRATASIGLGSKSSLRVGGGREGVNETGIRHALGKGWYVDTSVQSTTAGGANDRTRNYGVMLERIIAY